MLFEMKAGIRFNRAVDIDHDYISLGGFSMFMGGTRVDFDFERYYITADEKDSCLVHADFRSPDEIEFPEIKKITEEMLRSVSEITEFFVYTGELGETDLQVASLDYLSFVLLDACEEIKVERSVVRKAVCVGCF